MSTPTDDHSLDPSVVALWRLHALIRCLVLGVPGGGFVVMGLVSNTGMATRAAMALVGLALAGWTLFGLVWPGLEYDAFRFAVRERDLLVSRGVIFRRWSAVPRDRIQYVDTRQGPLERLFGLAGVYVYTASGAIAEASIPGLAFDAAVRLRDELSKGGRDDGV